MDESINYLFRKKSSIRKKQFILRLSQEIYIYLMKNIITTMQPINGIAGNIQDLPATK